MEPTGLDHDDGIDGLSTERSIVLRRKGQHIGGIPLFAMAQMQKDKNNQMLNVRSCFSLDMQVIAGMLPFMKRPAAPLRGVDSCTGGHRGVGVPHRAAGEHGRAGRDDHAARCCVHRARGDARQGAQARQGLRGRHRRAPGRGGRPAHKGEKVCWACERTDCLAACSSWQPCSSSCMDALCELPPPLTACPSPTLCAQGPVAVGGKLENRLKLHKKAKLVTTLGRMTCKTRMGRENATAGQAELKLRLSDDQRSQVLPLLPPRSCTHCSSADACLSVLTLVTCVQLVAGTSFMNFRNDMAIAGNLAAQFSPTPETQVVSRCSLNSKSAGSVSVRVTSHDHPQLGYSLIVPLASALINRLRGKDVY